MLFVYNGLPVSLCIQIFAEKFNDNLAGTNLFFRAIVLILYRREQEGWPGKDLSSIALIHWRSEMKLIQARIRGIGALTESRWFELSPHLNLFWFPQQQYGGNFLRILQTINPPYAIETVKPFADFPAYIKQDGQTKRVHPSKRTVALAVFSATPALVKELAAISPVLYETDRIEVGRRLDYSRWINFVELAASTRWSEISDNIRILLDEAQRFAPERRHPLADIIRGLKPTDRIKDTLQGLLAHWLDDLPPELWHSSRQRIETTRAAVLRADHFQSARDNIRSRLPLLVVLGGCPSSVKKPGRQTAAEAEQDFASHQHLVHLISEHSKAIGNTSAAAARAFFDELNDQLAAWRFSSMRLRCDRSATGVLRLLNDQPVQKATDGPLLMLRQLQANAGLAIAFSRVVDRAEPMLLFDAPERHLPTTLQDELVDFIIKISKTSQCLYSLAAVDIFPKDLAGRRYNGESLAMKEPDEEQRKADGRTEPNVV
jgi:hypothetical protein